MKIGERLFRIMGEKNITMPQLSRMTGISRHTIFDWQRRRTNPGSDKIMVICEALEIRPEELLIGSLHDEAQADGEQTDQDYILKVDDIEMDIAKVCHDFSDAKKRRLVAYVSMLMNTKD